MTSLSARQPSKLYELHCRPDERFRDLSRQAAKAEPTYWTWPDEGEPFLTDREGRPLSTVKAELERAFDRAERLEVIVAETETLKRGRIFGPTLGRRLRTSIETILKVTEWNLRVAAALEQRGSRSTRSELNWSRRSDGD